MTIAALVLSMFLMQDGATLFRDNCARCHGTDGAGISGVDFRTGQFRRVTTDDDLLRLIASGIEGTAMPPTNLPDAARRSLVTYLRSMRNTVTAAPGAGNPDRGRAVFEGASGCLQCHRVAGRGSRVGPNLSEIGSIRRAPDLEKSILDPNAAILATNRYVQATLKNGTSVTGRRLNEDSESIQLIDQRERLVSLLKSDLREYSIMKTSPMPSFQGKLSPQDVADVVAYLLTLKGTPQ